MLRFVKWTTVVLLLLGLAVAPAAAQGSGAISGAVRNANTGAGIVGVTVYVLDSAGGVVASETTGTGGAYLATGLPAGTYYVKTYNTLGYIDEVYDNVYCEAALCAATLGAPVVLLAGAPVNGIDFTLDVGGSISGTVTNAATGAPLANIFLLAYDAAGKMGASATTDASGAYLIRGLVAGRRYVRTFNVLGWVDELYDDFPCPGGTCSNVTTGTPIVVAAGSTTSPIDFGLDRGGAITGTVAAAGSGSPLQSVLVPIYDSTGAPISQVSTDKDGIYTKSGLPAGSYYVGTLNFLGYLDELYDDIKCPGATCDPTAGAAVAVVADETTKDIDFSLEPGGRISGKVTHGTGGLGSVRVAVYDSTGTCVGRGLTNGEGEYTTTALQPGTYYLKSTNHLGYIDEVYDNLPCDGGVCPDVTGGTGIAIAGTGTTPGVDFALELAGSISGSVWDDETSAPLAGVSVFVYNAAGIQVGVGYTNASGAYAVGGLAGGTHYARTGNSYGFVDELFGFHPCPMGACPPVTSGDAIEVTAGATTPGISFWLSVGGAVTGTVAHAVWGYYLDGVSIFIYDSAGSQVGFGEAAGGVFMLDQLPAGSYYLRTVNAAGFVDELYDNLPCPGGVCPPVTSGTAISVASGVMTGDIDFRLMPLLPGGSVRSDFTGDLTSDLLWRGTGGDLWLWGIENAAHATDAYVGAVADPNWEIKGQGDLNGDGMTDLVWRHKLDGTVYYWQMDGAMPAAELFVATVDISYDIVGTGDFDGDGKADLLWRNPVIGDLWLWRMNGAEVLGQSYVDTVDLSYAIRGLGDVNGDLKADVIWQGVAGDLWVWLMNGAVKDAQAYVGTVADPSYQVQQIADFDADMKADLLWWNSVAGDVWIWRLDGADVLSEHYVGLVANTDYRIQAAGDYNGDQKADILWRNVVAGDMWIWLMDGPAKASEAYLGTVGDPGYQIVK